MGIFDELKKVADKAEDLIEEHDDQVLEGIDKAADLIDDKTGGKHADTIDKGADKAKETVRKLAEEG